MTEQAVDKGIPTETCIHDLKKMLIYSIIKNGKKCILQKKLILKIVSHQESNPGTLSSETYAFPHDHHVAQFLLRFFFSDVSAALPISVVPFCSFSKQT